MRRRDILALGAVLAVSVAVATFTGSAASRPDSANAAEIDSIEPMIAERGGIVTIEGHGFGGPNVKISVGDDAAVVLSATGSRVIFRVPALAGPGDTTVTATNPVGIPVRSASTCSSTASRRSCSAAPTRRPEPSTPPEAHSRRAK